MILKEALAIDDKRLAQIVSPDMLRKVVSAKVLNMKSKDLEEVCYILSWTKEESTCE